MATKSELQLVISAKDEATAKLKQFSNNLSSVSGVVSNVTKAVGMLSIAISGAAVAMGTKAVKASIAYENALLGLTTVARAFNVNQEDAKKAAIELASDGLMPVSEAAAGLKNLLATGFSLPESIQLMKSFKDSAAFNRQGMLGFGEAIVGATQGIKNQNSIMVDNAGITKNLSIILEEAGMSQQDLMKVTTDASVRQALYNGIVKEASIFQGDAAKATETTGGSISKLQTSMTELLVVVGDQLIPYVQQVVEWMDKMTQSFKNNDETARNLADTFKFVWDVIVQLIGFVKAFQKALENVFYAMIRGNDIVLEVWKNIGETIKKQVDSIISAWKKMVDYLSKPVKAVINVFKKEKDNDDGKAFGGSVNAGSPYLVGEYRPEVFVPSQSGNIRQVDQAGGGREITINFNNPVVRQDADIDEIVSRLEKVLNRKQEFYSIGAY